jgi:hypothetical protein
MIEYRKVYGNGQTDHLQDMSIGWLLTNLIIAAIFDAVVKRIVLL